MKLRTETLQFTRRSWEQFLFSTPCIMMCISCKLSIILEHDIHLSLFMKSSWSSTIFSLCKYDTYLVKRDEQ